MEEKKESKVVDMKVEEKSSKLSYEKLEALTSQTTAENEQLKQELRQMYMRLQQSNMANIFKRMEFLIAIVDSKAPYSEEFKKRCIEEIENTMTLPEKGEEQELK